MKSNGVYYAALILAAVFWGANFGVSRWVMDVFPPEFFVLIRFGSAVPLLFGLLLWSEGSVRVDRKDLLKLAGIGLFGVTLLEILVMYSIKYTTLANASLLNVAPWPIFAALLAPLMTREPVTRRLIVGGTLALFGVALVILGGPGGLDFSGEHMLGNGMALAVSLLGALMNLTCMPLMQKYSPLRVSAWFIGFGSLFLVPYTWGDWTRIQWENATALSWIAIVYNVVLCTFLAFVLWNWGMSRTGAAKANFFRYLAPVAAVLAGAMFFDEPVRVLQLAGGLVMVAGLYWIGSEKPVTPAAQQRSAEGARSIPPKRPPI